MTSILIQNAKIVNEGEITEGDVFIRNGYIETIASSISNTSADKIINAHGKILMPGMIDDQVHFREPGMPDKADLFTESRAAVAGGITSFMDMPNTIPNALSQDLLEDKVARAAKKSVANYSFYLGASNDNLEAIKALDPKAACGVKVFMGASTGNMLVDNPDTLEQIFRHSPTLIATHCEDTPTISANEEKYRKQYGDDISFKFHPLIRSEEACVMSSTLAMDLATQHDSRLHVLHISTKTEADRFSSVPLKDKKITAEACVHFLAFTDDDYAEKGALIKCNPAIKTAQDQQGIIKGLLEGRLDVIGTDHAPHTWEEKQGSYFTAPSGLPLVQYTLVSLLEHYHRNTFTLEFIVEKTSHAVAELFDIKERGYIREGYRADLVLVDLHKPSVAKNEEVISRCGWTPFDGKQFQSSIDTTIVNGEIVWEDSKLQSDKPGMRLAFAR
jgi:dihydroorotase